MTTLEVPVRRHRGALPVVLSGVFMATLDFFIVNVAIPSMQRDLAATAAQVEWIVAGFGLAYGVGLVTGGRLGDLYGRRRLFAAGLALFTAASAACGLAPDAGLLVAARILQGLAAALVAPQVLAIIGTTYTGTARARAFNAYAMTMGVAAVLGQLVGGLLIDADVLGLGWRACFLINLPVGAAALVLTPRLVPESRATGRSRLDLGGTALVTLALLAVVLPLIEGRQLGWPRWTWLCLGAAPPLFAAFTAYQRRQRAPLVDLSLFRDRAFGVGLLAQLTFFLTQAAYFLVLALYLQPGRGLRPMRAGLLFVAVGGGYLVTSAVAAQLAHRWGRRVIVAGALLKASGLALLVLAVSTTGAVAALLPGLVVEGAGTGLALAPLASTVLARVPPGRAGSASGLLTTALQVGNAIGVAIIGVVFYHALGHSAGRTAYAHAFRISLTYLIAVALFLAVVVRLLPAATTAPTGQET
jgi:EmrB/QacA subfamily drug resistance transporter